MIERDCDQNLNKCNSFRSLLEKPTLICLEVALGLDIYWVGPMYRAQRHHVFMTVYSHNASHMAARLVVKSCSVAESRAIAVRSGGDGGITWREIVVRSGGITRRKMAGWLSDWCCPSLFPDLQQFFFKRLQQSW